MIPYPSGHLPPWLYYGKNRLEFVVDNINLDIEDEIEEVLVRVTNKHGTVLEEIPISYEMPEDLGEQNDSNINYTAEDA